VPVNWTLNADTMAIARHGDLARHGGDDFGTPVQSAITYSEEAAPTWCGV